MSRTGISRILPDRILLSAILFLLVLTTFFLWLSQFTTLFFDVLFIAAVAGPITAFLYGLIVPFNGYGSAIRMASWLTATIVVWNVVATGLGSGVLYLLSPLPILVFVFLLSLYVVVSNRLFKRLGIATGVFVVLIAISQALITFQPSINRFFSELLSFDTLVGAFFVSSLLIALLFKFRNRSPIHILFVGVLVLTAFYLIVPIVAVFTLGFETVVTEVTLFVLVLGTLIYPVVFLVGGVICLQIFKLLQTDLPQETPTKERQD